jgi:hypothetical protein
MEEVSVSSWLVLVGWSVPVTARVRIGPQLLIMREALKAALAVHR